MLSSLSMQVRMLDGRDRGLALDMNREIALDLIARGDAVAIEDVTAKDALEPWDQKRLAKFLENRTQSETKTPTIKPEEVKLPEAEAEVVPASVSAEISTPRSKRKKR